MQPQNKKSVLKIAALLSISEILEKAKIKVRFVRCNQREIILTLVPSKNIPAIKLIEDALKMLQEAFGIIVSCSTFSTPRSIVPKPEAIRVAALKKNMQTSQIF